MRLLIMGAPGAGKGTQATRIAEHWGIPAISTGAIFRGNVRRGTELGKQVASILESGNFVPDDITEKLVANRLAEPDAADGWLLDGFPRTTHQVAALDRILANRGETLHAVLLLDIDTEVVVGRILKRAEIEGRADDTEDVIRHRMSVYRDETEPLLEEYRSRGLLVTVDGDGTVDEVADRVRLALDGVSAR